jgi:large subunit ribosomal protein L15
MPISRRIPKRGFSNYRHTTEYQTVNVKDLETRFEAGALLTVDELYAARLVSSSLKPVKILGDGDLTKGFTVKANAFSASAKGKIESAGGKAEVV